MDHMPAGKLAGSSKRRGIVRYRSVLAAPLITLVLNAGASMPGNRGCHAPAVLKLSVGSIDDGVDLGLGQVAMDQL